MITRHDADGLVGADAVVVDNGTLTMATRDPGTVLARLAAEHSLDGLQVQGATLEDVFLDLTGRELRS